MPNPLPGLKDVAEQANVPMLTAYYVLSNTAFVEDRARQAVIDAAAHLGYRLNITIRDVADQAHVSIATVSYVLNNSVAVSAATRERVLDAVAALGYRPNITARNLKASQTRMIGYAWHDVMPGQVNPILDRFIYCMALAAESYGYHVLTFTQPAENAVQTYEELIHTNRVDGFVVSNTNRDDERIRRLLDMKIPFAAFGRANDDWEFSYVDVDGRCGIEEAVQHLLANGHQRIGLLGWPDGSLAGDARLQGYYDAMQSAGIEPLNSWIERAHNTVNDGRLAAKQLLSFPDGQHPTALVCVSDMMAIGAMNCVEAMGLGIGTDIAITGFDDHPMSEFLRPPLTSLRQPIELLARHVIDLLVAQIEKRQPVEPQVLLPPTLVVRASSSQTLV
jgi:DNA-binding LacI/PurR family transcriptional regulator